MTWLDYIAFTWDLLSGYYASHHELLPIVV